MRYVGVQAVSSETAAEETLQPMSSSPSSLQLSRLSPTVQPSLPVSIRGRHLANKIERTVLDGDSACRYLTVCSNLLTVHV